MDSFTLFPHLLPELRLQIWKQALLHPRLVLIYKHSTKITFSSTPHIRRTLFSPLLSVSRESRLEALNYYFPPTLYPDPPTLFPKYLTPPTKTSDPNPDISTSFPIHPGTDILYISGTDPPPPSRRRTPVTWTLTHISDILSSPTNPPSISQPKNLAIDLSLLLTTPFSKTPKFLIPYGVWKFIICAANELEFLLVVRSSGGCDEESEEDRDWDAKEWVEMRLEEARKQFLEFWDGMTDGTWNGDGDGDESGDAEGDEIRWLKGWKAPKVEVVELEELVGRCWV